MTTIQEQCLQRSIDPRIGALLHEFSATHTVVVCISEVDNFRLSIESDAYAAVYPSRGWMDIALAPEDAAATERRHGLRVTKANDTTAYVRVLADYLDTDAGRAVALALLAAAWDKAEKGPRWDPTGANGQRVARGELCTDHFVERSITGSCALCED